MAKSTTDTSASSDTPQVVLPTNIYAFSQALNYVCTVAAQATTLDQLRTFLTSLATDTQRVVDAITASEQQVIGIVRSGASTFGPAPAAAPAAAQ